MSPPSALAASQRWRAIRRTIASGGVARVLSMGCSLAQVPVALLALGNEGFGFVSLLVIFASLVNFADLGLGSVAQTALADAYGRTDLTLLRARFIASWRGHLLRSWGWTALLLPLTLVIDWRAHLQLDPFPPATVRLGLVLALSAIVVGLPLTLAPRLALALQRGWLPAWWTAASNAALLLWFFVAKQLGAPALAFAAGACAAPMLANLALLWQLRQPQPPVDPALVMRERQTLERDARLYAGPQLATGLMSAALPSLVASFGGASAVTGLALVQRLFGLLGQAHALAVQPFWPAFAEAAARGEWDWTRRAVAWVVFGTIGLFWPLLVLGTWCIQPVVTWWTSGVTLAPGRGFVGGVAAWVAAQMAGQVLQTILLGLGRWRPLAIFGLAGPLGAAVGMMLAGSRWQETGVIAGAAIGYGICGLSGFALETARVLRPR